jgi:hypothetical protein
MASSVPSILDPSLTALYGSSVVPNLSGLDLSGLGGLAANRSFGLGAAQPLHAPNAVEDAVRLACSCGIEGCDCQEAVSEINGNSSLLNHLQSNFQTQQLSMLVQMLIMLMQNRGLLKPKGQGKQNKVEKAGSSGEDSHGHSHGASSASSGGASSNGEVPAVTRQGKQIGAKIAAQFDQMVAAAAKDGVKLQIESGLRTHAEQEKLYQAYLNGTGNLAAKPGTSNHESGEAIDYVNNAGAFDWLKKNAANFGFHGNVAGEPWHYSLTGN